jgi:Flp pilus assembly protein TadB
VKNKAKLAARRVSARKAVSRLERALEQLSRLNAQRQYSEWPLEPSKTRAAGRIDQRGPLQASLGESDLAKMSLEKLSQLSVFVLALWQILWPLIVLFIGLLWIFVLIALLRAVTHLANAARFYVEKKTP